MRKLAIIFALLLGLAIGYMVGCHSHGQARTVTAELHSGQRWRDRDGQLRTVRAVQHERRGVRVWWFRDEADRADHECSVGTWRAWVRNRQARVVE